MESVPRLSLCIPTHALRTAFLKVALASAIQEALAFPAGTVEVLVSENDAPEPTKALLREFQARQPWLRVVGFPENRGFDANYLNCFREARGEFVWVLGDDDMFLPGCVARVLEAVDAGADVILCGAFECDVDMKPLQPRGWFREPQPATAFRIDGPEALAGYLRLLGYEAGAFAFISAAIVRRERFLAGYPVFQAGIGSGCLPVMGMMVFLAAPANLHWIPQPLFLNRLGNDQFGEQNPWGRLNVDLTGWIRVADTCFPEPGELRDAFMGVLRRNHQDVLVRALRTIAGPDRERWREGRARLLAVGFDPLLVATVAFGHDLVMMDVPPPRGLDPAGLCLADLATVARGARRVAVLAELGLEAFLAASALLEGLRLGLPGAVIRVVCPPELVPLLAGFEPQALDRDRLLRDDGYLQAQLEAIRGFAPDLLVNLDRRRGIAGDLLAEAAGAAGVLGFDDETPENRDQPDRLARIRAYRRLLPRDAPYAQLAEALGLAAGPERVWPDPASRDQAGAALAARALEPGRTLAVLGDAPAALARDAQALAQAVRAGWTPVGLGGPGTEAPLARALAPFGSRALNLGGTLPLAAMAAVLQRCDGFLGGSAAFQALAGAAGCPGLPGRRS